MYFFSGAEVCTNFTPVFEVMSINCGTLRLMHASFWAFCAPSDKHINSNSGQICKVLVMVNLLNTTNLRSANRIAGWPPSAPGTPSALGRRRPCRMHGDKQYSTDSEYNLS